MLASLFLFRRLGPGDETKKDSRLPVMGEASAEAGKPAARRIFQLRRLTTRSPARPSKNAGTA